MELSRPFAEIGFQGLMFTQAPNIPFNHCFTTRTGGVSSGFYESLNLGESTGDAPENVRENYRRLFKALGIKERTLCFTKQVHGNEVRIVTEDDAREPFSPFLYEADGLVTNVKGLPLICFMADCVPVLLCDSESGVVAAVHCGWRSTVADILGVAVKRMISLGALPSCIRAAIGPAIDLCCFETDAEVPEAVIKLLGSDSEGAFFELGGTGKFMVDLKETNRRRLMQLGLRERNIAVSDECTSCNPDRYWSHRRTGTQRGSQAAIIVIG